MIIQTLTAAALTTPYPALPVSVGEVALVRADQSDVACVCGNQDDYLPADRTGCLVDPHPAPAGTAHPHGLADPVPDGLSICARCGRVYDDALLGTPARTSPVLARVNVHSREWIRAQAIYQHQLGNGHLTACPRCASTDSFPALIHGSNGPEFVRRCAFCGTTRDFPAPVTPNN